MIKPKVPFLCSGNLCPTRTLFAGYETSFEKKYSSLSTRTDLE